MLEFEPDFERLISFVDKGQSELKNRRCPYSSSSAPATRVEPFPDDRVVHVGAQQAVQRVDGRVDHRDGAGQAVAGIASVTPAAEATAIFL